MLSHCAQTSLRTPLRSEHYAMLLLQQDAKTWSMVKRLTAVARLACIVYLNREWNALFAHP